MIALHLLLHPSIHKHLTTLTLLPQYLGRSLSRVLRSAPFLRGMGWQRSVAARNLSRVANGRPSPPPSPPPLHLCITAPNLYQLSQGEGENLEGYIPALGWRVSGETFTYVILSHIVVFVAKTEGQQKTSP